MPALDTAGDGDAAEVELIGVFGAENLRVELQRPLPAPRPLPQPWLVAREELGRALRCDREMSIPTTERGIGCRTLSSRSAIAHPGGSESQRRGNSEHYLPPGNGRAFAEHPEAVDESVRLAERCPSI